jgi:hypothetical protein
MPTGYTAGIIDGTTKTFNEFATICMRAFGATIHMRDENMDKPYEPRIPSDYHTKELQKAKEKLEQAEKLTDNKLIELEIKKLNERKEYHVKRITEAKEVNKRLNDFLSKAKVFEPPTKEHENIKDFMIEQISKTIDFDGKYEYNEKELVGIEIELKNIDANIVRAKLIEDANNDIEYHTKKHKEELKRCEDSNKWVEQFLNALD